MLSPDRNNPETVAWLDYCRSQNRQLTAEEFEDLIPEFIAVHDRLEADKRVREAH